MADEEQEPTTIAALDPAAVDSQEVHRELAEAAAFVPADDDSEVPNSPRKRTASERQEEEELPMAAEAADPDAMVEHEVEEEDPEGADRKRQRTSRKGKSAPPPKKLNNEQWDAMYEKLIEYKQEHGDCLVPKRYEKNPKLGTWVETQRVQYKKLQKASADGDAGVVPNKRLNAERLERLEAIGFAFSAKNMRKPKQTAPAAKKKPPTSSATDSESRAAARHRLNELHWNEMYGRLVKYKEMHGDCLVPKKYEADPKLATWVEMQRVLHNRDYRRASDSHPQAETPSQAAAAGTKNENPEEWATVIETGAGAVETATEEDVAAVVAATMEAAAMEVVEQVTADAAVTEAALAATEDSKPAAVEPLLEPATLEAMETAAPEPASLEPEPMDAAPMETMETSPEPAAKEPGEAVQLDAATSVETAPDQASLGVATVEETVTATETAVAGAVDHVSEAVDSTMSHDVTGETTPEKPIKRLTEDRKAKLDSIGFVWSLRSKRVDDHWDEMFEKLVAYKLKHGDCLVPSRYEEDFKLGKWVETQRYEYTKLQRASGGPSDLAKSKERAEQKTAEVGASTAKPARHSNPRLTEKRLRRLESIGFEFKVRHKMKRYYDRQWDNMYERLLEYKKEHGHCMVPKRHPPDMKLGTWVHTQRIQYRKLLAGTPSKTSTPTESESAGVVTDDAKGDDETSFRLTEDRRRRLEEAGFVWSARENEKPSEPSRITRNSYDDQWDAQFERLRAYKEAKGNCLVPKRYKEDPKLGTWVDTQRVQYKKMRKQLDKLGIEWKGPQTQSDAGGETNEDDSSKKTAAKPLVGRLTDERIARLEALGFVWSLRDDWQKHYQELIEFKKEHGHCNVPARYEANRKLGIWVSAQRQQYKIMNMSDDLKPRRSAPLTMERVNLLNELGFTWSIRSRDSLGESWNQRLEDLRQYQREHGNTLVPSRYAPNPELGVWVGTQRTQYRLYMKAKETNSSITSSMNEERIRQLEELGFVFSLRGASDKLVPDVAAAVLQVQQIVQNAQPLVQPNAESIDSQNPQALDPQNSHPVDPGAASVAEPNVLADAHATAPGAAEVPPPVHVTPPAGTGSVETHVPPVQASPSVETGAAETNETGPAETEGIFLREL